MGKKGAGSLARIKYFNISFKKSGYIERLKRFEKGNDVKKAMVQGKGQG